MSNDLENLWGDDFIVPKDTDKAKQVKEKIKKPSTSKKTVTDKSDIKKAVKSNSISLTEKLKLIEIEVLRVLGKQKDNVIVIYDYNEYIKYLENALRYGRIAIDTETNNSLDPITCKIMGLCLYYNGGKQAYVPVNHRNPITKERLSNQLQESDIKDGLDFLINNKTFNSPFIVTHNGKFDYQVIKCTTGVSIPIHWDTLIGAKLLDENEFSARLKDQYVNKIDPEQEKYSIDHLFEGVEYADVDPEIFALYAATDSMMTDKLYQWQMDKFKDPDLKNILNLANTIEMPLVQVIAEMELAGMEVDQEYAQKLSAKYHTKLDIIDNKIATELENLRPMIEAWRLTPEANFQPRSKKPNKDGEYKLQKSKNEQLKDPIELNSPTQLAILFYDILKAPVVNTKSPRGTGEDELEAINKKLKLPICDLIIQRRGIVKLLTTYIDTIPELAKRWPDGRVRTHFNAYGAATGRLSSSDPINF